MINKRIYIFFVLLFLAVSFSALPQNDSNYSQALNELNRKGEVYFTFYISNKQILNDLTKVISIDRVERSAHIKVWSYADKAGFEKFLSYNINYIVQTHPGDLLKNPRMFSIDEKDLQSWDAYPEYDAYVAMLYQFETNYPDLCEIIPIGYTIEGRQIIFAKITDNVSTYEAEPRFMYTSSMHGDETTGYVLMLRLIDYLLAGYDSITQVTELVNSLEIWINPLANPDGTYANGNSSVSGATRYNSAGVDINRNFPNPIAGSYPNNQAWQPECIAMMNLMDSVHFVMAANFHGGAEVANYPWDSWTSNEKTHADDSWWQSVSTEYAQTVFANSISPYFKNPYYSGITNGGDWYVVYGSRQDYSNYYCNTREITIEISSTKILPPDQLPTLWEYNYRSFLSYMQQCTYGFRGIVTDSLTGEPLQAMIFIDGHDIDNSQVHTELPEGIYFRPISQGPYNLTFSSNGYQSKTISATAANQASLVIDAQLVKTTPVPDFSSTTTFEECSGLIEFTNESFASPETQWLWDFGDGEVSTQENPTHYYQSGGIYTVSLTATNSAGSDAIIKEEYIEIALPPVPEVINSSACDSASSLELSAYGTGRIFWYSMPDSGVFLDTGAIFTTPILNQTTTYYAENHLEPNSGYVGMYDNSAQGEYYNYNVKQYMIFDCFSAIKLKSVKVYANSEGERVFELQDSLGNILDSVTVLVPSGESRVYLNFSINTGNNYRLAGPPAPDLYKNQNNFDDFAYPYTLEDTISITGNSADNPGIWYFFYDWEFKGEDCVSDRAPVYAIINEVPVANFDHTVSNSMVNFENQSSLYVSAFWDFGDGITSTEINPDHEYLLPGTYNVKLIASNTCGEDTAEYQVTIAGIYANEDNNDIAVYPNPASERLIILNNSTTPLTEFTLYDIYGNAVIQNRSVSINGRYSVADLSGIASGLYFLTVRYNSGAFTKKIIVNK